MITVDMIYVQLTWMDGYKTTILTDIFLILEIFLLSVVRSMTAIADRGVALLPPLSLRP